MNNIIWLDKGRRPTRSFYLYENPFSKDWIIMLDEGLLLKEGDQLFLALLVGFSSLGLNHPTLIRPTFAGDFLLQAAFVWRIRWGMMNS